MSEPYYDIDDDWHLIYASFQSQYGIRLSHDLKSMSWREFSYLINGLSGETPLGRVVSIRAEKDPERLKEFTSDEKKIRNDYLSKQAKKMPQEKADKAIEQMRQIFIAMGKTNEETEV